MRFSIDSITKFYESIFNEAIKKDKSDSWKSNIKSLKVSLFGKVIKPENVADVENIEFSKENYQSLLGNGVKTPIEFVRMGGNGSGEDQFKKLSRKKGDEHNEDRTKFLGAIKPILEHPSFIISFTKPTLNQEELKRVKNGLRVPEKHPYNIYFRPCKIDGKTIPLMCIVAMMDNGPTLISCREVKDLYDTVKNGDKLLYKIEDSQQENN